MIKGFTCGAMDLLHAGHLLMLKECKKDCDYLIVGLQSDPTLDRPQKNKPIEYIDERLERLTACKYVDEIVIYNTENELIDILNEIKPDIRFLGEDWKGKEFTGHDLSIPVIFTSRQHNYSSSNLRQRILDSVMKTAGGFKLYAFDMDGTICESKQSMDPEMAILLRSLLKYKNVAVTSGASKEQILKQIGDGEIIKQIFILPTNGSSLCTNSGTIYETPLTLDEKKSVFTAFGKAMKEVDIFSVYYGRLFEDRGSQITFSGKGSEASLDLKKEWDPTRAKRETIVGIMKPLLPEFTISIAGTTSIDVTKKGIDKSYGMKKLAENIGIQTQDIFYVGDALFPGGNDEVVKNVVGQFKEVSSPEDTKKFIRHLLSNL